METMFFSFGHGQACPMTQKRLLDHHVRVVAPTRELCRAAMVQMFGPNWSFPYDSLEELTSGGQFPTTEYLSITFGGDV